MTTELTLEKIIQEIKQGKIFIYPTDTIYGIGCDATNKQSVNKIKSIKSRDKDKPLSVIAPSIDWIKKNCITKNTNLDKYFPGPYTLILKKKNPKFLQHVSNTDSLGIRIPDNFFTRIIQDSNLPFITTSVNLQGEPFLTNIKDLKPEIKNKVDIIINQGPLTGEPSTLIINGKEIKR